jgi:hypothetical protein
MHTSESSNSNLPCSTSCKTAIPPTILVQLAIQNVLSNVIFSLLSAPLRPDAWLKISSPCLLTATKTKPGMFFVGDAVVASIAGILSVYLSSFYFHQGLRERTKQEEE